MARQTSRKVDSGANSIKCSNNVQEVFNYLGAYFTSKFSNGIASRSSMIVMALAA